MLFSLCSRANVLTAPTLGRLPLPISLRSLSPILAATLMPPRGLPTLVVLPPVASSSVAPRSYSQLAGASSYSFAPYISRNLLSTMKV